MNVQPGATFEAVSKFPTGLAGTLGIRITDNEGGTVLARTTAGIAEYPDLSGIYAVTLTAPGTAGQYSLIWDDGSNRWAVEDLLVTSEAIVGAVIGSGHLYVTRDALKDILRLTGESYADVAIDVAVACASDAINAYKGTRYYPTDESRFYTPESSRDQTLFIDDLVTLTGLLVDTTGDLSYDEEWTEDVDFVLDPPNAALEGQPKRQIVLLPVANRRFPTTPHAVKVEGTFGWAEAPSLVYQAAVLLANRFLTRTRAAPLGILVATANQTVATARLGGLDKDVAFLLDELPGSRQTVASIQLG